VVTVNREEARLMTSSKEGLSSDMMTEWGEPSSGVAVGSDNGTVDTAAYVQNTPKSHQLNLAFFVAGCCC